MCCSVRTLQLSYKTVFGTTVWEDIAEARMEKAQRLLAETKTPIGEIPELVGFESAHHFSQFFKARTGMSMSQFRRRARGGDVAAARHGLESLTSIP
jgi:AraC-like DNA-binding protein